MQTVMRLGHRTIAHALAAGLAALLLALPAMASAAQTDYDAAQMRGTKAVAPKAAPKYVKRMIRAGNRIRHKRYKWGGGHRSWNDKGYDCSGAVSYVLHKAGLLDYPLASGGFERWGEAGRSKWVTIYANEGHVFMVVAGLRWDTSYVTDGDRSGPGWSEVMRSDTRRFKIRHPDGSRNW